MRLCPFGQQFGFDSTAMCPIRPPPAFIVFQLAVLCPGHAYAHAAPCQTVPVAGGRVQDAV